MIDVRDGLKIVINKSGMKQIAIAERANMKDQQLCDIVNKRRKLDANELFTLCKILGVSPIDAYEEAEREQAAECDGRG